MATWGRGDALAELWGLVVEAIRTPTATRTTQQQDVVNWLTAMIRRKGEAAAVNAGWEYLKWAGTCPVPEADPRRTPSRPRSRVS